MMNVVVRGKRMRSGRIVRYVRSGLGRHTGNERGATIVLVSVCMVALLSGVALGIDPAVLANRTMPTTSMSILGPPDIEVASRAIEAVSPVDMILVLDQSGSLGSMNAWDDLQAASKSFVANFDDNLDQVGLVSFNIRGADRFLISGSFTSPIHTEIDNMNSVGYTNTGEGLRLAFQQMQSATVRQRSAKVVVFFTDGRPTASRDIFNGQDRIMAVPWATSNNVAGYWDNPMSLPLDVYAGPDGCSGVPLCFGMWDEPLVRAKTLQDGIDQAAQLRADGILVYTIALGNPAATDPLQTPDLGYLALLANENGIADAGQPQGRSYFAPSAAELQAVFDQVASDLLARLSQ